MVSNLTTSMRMKVRFDIFFVGFQSCPSFLDLGVTDLTEAFYADKASVGMARYRNMTLLTPAEQDRKNARIAAKMRAALS